MTKQPLVECVPNFSEGRNQETIDAIINTIKHSGKVHVLDVSSDADHNRTVVTLAGQPEALEKALFEAIKKAAELIDMDQHSGEHQRFGATDVVPFIPIRDISMDECVAMAKRLGKRVGEELNIPVFLYEEAAQYPHRQNLAKIRSRKFQYEQLKETIATDDSYEPDFGPKEVGKAGATIIGARPFLIAFNVFLNTDNVDIAKKIGRAVRASSGGFAYVKGAGFLVEGKAQVSMNLTNYQKTPIFRVVETIRREAQRYGVGVLSSELIGLAPQEAFIDSAQWYLQLDGFQPDQLLETRVAQAEAESGSDQSTRPSDFVESVAAPSATPGGGAVAALAGSLAAGLTEMVAGLTVGKKRYADVQDQMEQAASDVASLRQRLLDDVVNDVQAFDELMAAFRTDKEDPNRAQLIEEKTWGAAEVPFRVTGLAIEVLQVSEVVARHGNKNAATDAAVAAHMAVAAIEGAALNVRINLTGLDGKERINNMLQEVEEMRKKAHQIRDEVVQLVEKRAGL
jgi:glutamate formiminotransferase/formiminotetrahydrofolate cyclodeaminase